METSYERQHACIGVGVRRFALVTIERPAFRQIVATAAANLTELVGIMIGRSTGPLRWRVTGVIPIASCKASENEVQYYVEDVEHAKRIVVEVCGPEESLGLWHQHPWTEFRPVVLGPQLTKVDESEMMRPGDLLGIAVAYPDPGCLSPVGVNKLRRRVGPRVVDFEVWRKDEEGRSWPCEMRLR